MASLKGQCSVTCKGDKRACWHTDCTILRRFKSGKFLIENRHGYVRAAVPSDMFFSVSEEREYSEYNLRADELELEADADREKMRNSMVDKLQSKFNVRW